MFNNYIFASLYILSISVIYTGATRAETSQICLWSNYNIDAIFTPYCPIKADASLLLATYSVTSDSKSYTEALSSTAAPTDGPRSRDHDHGDSTLPFMPFEQWKEHMMQKRDDTNSETSDDNPTLHRFANSLLDLPTDSASWQTPPTPLLSPSSTPVEPTPSQQTSSTGVVATDEVKLHHHPSKDAGKTCKERFSYSSFDAGATVLKTTKGAKNAKAILRENKDSYMLMECATKNKFVVIELSDDILVDTVVIANFEFFSSMVRRFRVSASDRYPVKIEKWVDLGTFEARNSRDIQAFLVRNPKIYARYVRIEFLTHYGNEYYCPVSLVRVHGTTMIESWKEAEGTGDESLTLDERPHEEEGDRDMDMDEQREAEIKPAELEKAEEKTPLPDPPAVSSEPSHALEEEIEVPVPKHMSQDVEPRSSLGTAESTSTEDGLGTQPEPKPEPLGVKWDDYRVSPNVALPAHLFKSCDTCKVQLVWKDILYDQAITTSTSISFSASVALDSLSKTTLKPSTQESRANITTTSHATKSPESAAPVTQTTPIASTEMTTASTVSTTTQTPSSTVVSESVTFNSSSTTTIGSKLADSQPRSKTPVTPPSPVVQESFFKSISKRLQHLEMNVTLSIRYLEEQSHYIHRALDVVDRQQRMKADQLMATLNKTVIQELRALRIQYDQMWESTVVSREAQREQYEREMLAMGARLNVLAEEVVFQKRMSIGQSVLLLSCLVLVIFSRSVITPPMEWSQFSRSHSRRGRARLLRRVSRSFSAIRESAEESFLGDQMSQWQDDGPEYDQIKRHQISPPQSPETSSDEMAQPRATLGHELRSQSNQGRLQRRANSVSVSDASRKPLPALPEYPDQ